MAETRFKLTIGLVVQLLLVVILIPLLPVLLSGRWGWVEGWVYFGVCASGFIISRALAGRQHPDLLQERGHSLGRADAAPWDKVLAPVVGLGSGVIPLVIGLDARWGWSAPYPAAVRLLGGAAVLAGYGFAGWALVANRFFSGVVRIQADRGHQVVAGGPYAFVRHPGYAGALLSFVGMPLLLDSRWGLLPVAVLLAVLVLRTALEDRALQAQLPGYREYAQRVRWRLLPGVW